MSSVCPWYVSSSECCRVITWTTDWAGVSVCGGGRSTLSFIPSAVMVAFLRCSLSAVQRQFWYFDTAAIQAGGFKFPMFIEVIFSSSFLIYLLTSLTMSITSSLLSMMESWIWIQNPKGHSDFNSHPYWFIQSCNIWGLILSLGILVAIPQHLWPMQTFSGLPLPLPISQAAFSGQLQSWLTNSGLQGVPRAILLISLRSYTEVPCPVLKMAIEICSIFWEGVSIVLGEKTQSTFGQLNLPGLPWWLLMIS